MRKTLRNSFLVTTAAAALVTGITIASAQTGDGGMKGGGGDHGMSQGRSGGGGGHSAGHAQTPSGGNLGTQSHTQKSESGQSGRPMGGERGKALSEQKGGKQLGEQRGKTAGTQERTGAQTTTQGRTGAQTGFAQGGAQGRVSLNENQRTRIHSVVVNKNFTSRFGVSNVSFAVRTGTVVPRSFHLFAVPADIMTIAPRFRGFRFFIWEDEIVFVDPVTFEIVAIIPV